MAEFDHMIYRKKNHNLKPANSVMGILKRWGTSQIFRRGSKK